jgi:subtilisin family serine protease
MSARPSRARRTRRLLFTVGTTGLLAIGAGFASTASGGPSLAPVLHKSGAPTIPNQYVVVFKRGTTPSTMLAAQSVARTAGGKIGYTYGAALTGFSVTATPAQLDQLRALPEVDYVEPDVIMTADVVIHQASPPLGLDRTSERYLALDGDYTYTAGDDGTGVHVYVIDTGIRATHVELAPRVSASGFTAIADGNGTNDCQGHGTHVAGTVGGTTYGIAKNVTLHPVRVLDCGGSGSASGVIAGVDWVAANAVHPAVANMSLGGPGFTALDTSVTNAIATGITFAIAAGNATPATGWLPVDACTQSPARVPNAITVGSVNPVNDTYSWFSNFGTCLDLFGPGEGIVSASNTSDTATATHDGTSQATPHVAGAAARFLQTHPAASPAVVQAAIMTAADTSAYPLWAGIVSLPAGSPNILLHWGALNDGIDDGDPHISTVGGIHYDFQSAGEFVLLEDGPTQLQTRQTAVETTTSPITNPYTGLTSCVSLNTAFAAKVGDHRLSFQPSLSGDPDPSGMHLRIDGALITPTATGMNLGAGGHVSSYGAGGIQVDFPDGTTSIVTPNWWPSESRWYLTVHVYHTPASEGIAGALAPGSWLPALPGGASMGPMPANLHQRFVDLNTTFADAWRVTNASSLFDYAPGTSTATFTFPSWPGEKSPCRLEGSQRKPVEPTDLETAKKVCSVIVDKDHNLDCVSDVKVTGELGFAKAHQISEAIQVGSTRTLIDDPQPQTQPGKPALFTITVGRNAGASQGAVPTGTVQLLVDGKAASGQIKLDRGQATITIGNLEQGVHQVSAAYAPAKASVYLASISVPVSHTVR